MPMEYVTHEQLYLFAQVIATVITTVLVFLTYINKKK